MAIDVKEWYDAYGMLNLTITWDSEDPYDEQLSTWTAADYLTAIKQACDEELSLGYKVRTDLSERVRLTRPSKENLP